MQERRNYYRILGVQPDAPDDVIRGVYRTLMQKLRMHPDLGGNQRDAAMINAAWRVLRHPDRRDAYDRQLLSDYDIRVLASAGAPSRAPPGASANRRNYYRILAVQADARQALIDSAYTAMSRADPDNALLQEAYYVIGDPDRRRRYDGSSTQPGSTKPEPKKRQPTRPLAPTPVGPTGYTPLILNYCAFCKTPHSPYPGSVTSDDCSECDSPLRRPESASARGARTFNRTDLTGTVQFYEYWPSQANHGRLEEFSPDGLRMTTQRQLEPGQVVRIAAAVFDAVANVVHCMHCGDGFSAGLELLTVKFGANGVVINVRS